jgi:hypothetical protein
LALRMMVKKMSTPGGGSLYKYFNTLGEQ